jgi:uncharacterized protein (UPF0332 family)
MSPRSEEFIAQSRRRLAAARHAIDAGDAEAAVSSAYYAMLYAARAALSERDVHAKTHGGTWSEFGREFVATGAIPSEIGKLGGSVQQAREQADYEAEEFTADEAATILGDAERFAEAVAALIS